MMMIIVSILLFLCPNVRYCGAMTIEILTMAIQTKNYNLQRPVMIINNWLCRYAVRQYFIFNHKHRFINLIYTLEQLVIYKYFNCLFYSIIQTEYGFQYLIGNRYRDEKASIVVAKPGEVISHCMLVVCLCASICCVSSYIFSQFTRKSRHNCNVANRRKIKMSAWSCSDRTQ